ncbi:MAG: D-glucuronyl C5-epimerase family protein [Cyclobacteriaceae bacterium]
MEESKRIVLPLGDVSLSKKLGVYYIDMRPAEIHYTHNIWQGGFDEKGVPMCGDGKGNLVYFPINIAQYGFILHAQYLENQRSQLMDRLLNCIAKLEELKTSRDGYTVWYHHNYESKYKIQPPWASAMAQGEVISFYLRLYQVTNNESLLQTSQEAYEFLSIDYSQGGVRRYDENGNLWLEEYPSEPPSYVLNGFIYTIFGLYDLYRVTGRSDVKADIDECIITLKLNLHRFDSGYWSDYDLQKKELVRYYYQKNVHVPQLAVLYGLTNERVFKTYKEKWQKTIHPLNFLLVQVMYRVRPRWQKLFKLWENKK